MPNYWVGVFVIIFVIISTHLFGGVILYQFVGQFVK